jgi:S1-C subfamily serine protease
MTPIKISSNLPKIGDDIMVAGSPQGLEGTISKGIISSIRKFDPYDYELIQISAPISEGSSGGPVVNSSGELIGISVSGMKEGQNLNFAVPVKYISHLLD